MMDAFFAWLQATRAATAVGGSILLTGTLSAVHLLGFTLVTGGALVANLRLLGVLLRDRAVLDVVRPAGRGVAIGLLVSVTSGVLLFAPRAPDAAANSTFQIKMLLLVTAAAFHATIHRAASRRETTPRFALGVVGAVGLLLWTGVAVAGTAFILLE
jgi:hypothetical protein